jgi:uncharacterized Zn-finger protein
MATPETGIPHFHNDVGVATIHVGSKEFMCIGARPPFDHPHIFIDMGSEDDAVCGYCGTHFRYKPSLDPGQAEPAECLWRQEKAA